MPLSVLSNWEKQIEDHVQPGALTSCVYYGATRAMTTEDLKKYDIVITTYQTVTNEHADASVAPAGDDGSTKKKRKTQGSLFQLSWKVRLCICDVGVMKLTVHCFVACCTGRRA